MVNIADVIPDLAKIKEALLRCQETVPAALLGFDGYIDKLVRLKSAQGDDTYYRSVKQFADFIGFMGATSADVAVHRIYEKIGGNGPLLALALAEKAVPVTCIGAMGWPALSPYYEPLTKKMQLFSLCETAESYVMEFEDGKLMFGDAECFEKITWDRVKQVVGLEKMQKLAVDSTLLCFANWSGLPKAQDLLDGILRDLCPVLQDGRKRSIFFDLADPSAKSHRQFEGLFASLEALSKTLHTVVGLNPKEAVLVYNERFHCQQTDLTEEMVQALVDYLGCDEVVIHSAGFAWAGIKHQRLVRVNGKLIQKPLISVGAGDNFNSGYCLGLLCGLNTESCAYLGNTSAVHFMETGRSASIRELIDIVSKDMEYV